MSLGKITCPVRDYYTRKVLAHGPTSRGVDWNSRESQELRFDQLLKVRSDQRPFSILDWGCGYGHLCGYMARKRMKFVYEGFDLSEEMVRRAREVHRGRTNAHFRVGPPGDKKMDYTVASGIFNVKLRTPKNIWKDYMLGILRKMNGLSRKGFAFNCLTRYSDKDRMRPDLYYADPLFLFDHCKRNFSKNVALLHDYGLYEFTLLVRKQL